MGNENSDKTYYRMCRMYVRVLRFVAVLPFDGRDFSFFYTRLLTCYLFCSSMIHWSMYAVYCFTSKSIQLEHVSLSILVVGLNHRYLTMMYNRKIFTSLFNECRALWGFCTEEGRQTVIFYEEKIRRVYLIFFFVCFFVNVMYPLDALTIRLPPLEPNGTERRILPFSWYADNMENSWPGYWSIFVLQTVVVQNAIVYLVACDTATPLLLMISSGYLRHLRNRLCALPEDTKLRISEQRRCIYFHKRLLKFCSKVAKFADTMLLTQVLSTGYNISLLLIKLISSDRDKYKYIPTLCIYVCQLYLVQWAPDYLYDESEGVAFAAYSAYSGSLDICDLNKHLLTVITRSQRPMQLLAGGFIPLSLESFGNIVKSAFSFFTVLRNLQF